MSENAFLWDVTAANNAGADPAVPWPEGMAPGAVNNAARAMMAAVARQLKDANGTISTTGSANAYLLTSSSGHVALTNGIIISAKASFTNTGAATLNLNSFGAKKIRVFADGAEANAAAGQIISGGTYNFRYDTALDSASGAFLLLNPATSGASVGTIKIWPSDTLETGWLWCNGAAVSRTTYSALFGILSTTYGVGDGTTTFNVPDLRGRAPFGSDDMGTTAASRITNAGSSIVGTTLGASGGVESVTLSTSQIPSHAHTGTTGAESNDHTHNVNGATSTESVGHTHSGTTATQSVDHTHAVSGTTSGVSATHTHTGTTGTESADHTHSYNTATGKTGTATGFGTLTGTIWNGADTSATSGGKSATHTHTVTTGTESADHTHTFSVTSGGVSADHTHTFTTGAVSASHVHSVNINSGGISAIHTHTFTSDGTGGGALHSNMPPALILNYAIKI